MFLNKIRYTGGSQAQSEAFPFTLPLFEQDFTLEFEKPVTILVGENGSGKSTFVESLAVASNAIQIGQMVEEYGDYAMYDALVPYLKMEWRLKNRQGFFFRADVFDGFIREINEQKAFAKRELARINAVDSTSLERMPFMRTLAELEELYPTTLSELSHGQSFLTLFKSRLRGNSIYILDEPETPLTPHNQLALLVLINDYVQQGSQFIIATHSPIIMAYPNAQLLEIQDKQIQPVAYEDIGHVQFMEQFMKDPSSFMHHLFSE